MNKYLITIIYAITCYTIPSLSMAENCPIPSTVLNTIAFNPADFIQSQPNITPDVVMTCLEESICDNTICKRNLIKLDYEAHFVEQSGTNTTPALSTAAFSTLPNHTTAISQPKKPQAQTTTQTSTSTTQTNKKSFNWF